MVPIMPLEKYANLDPNGSARIYIFTDNNRDAWKRQTIDSSEYISYLSGATGSSRDECLQCKQAVSLYWALLAWAKYY